MDIIDRLILDVCEFNSKYDVVPIWPCLVGPHGEGKTSRVIALARHLQRPLVRLLLSTRLPEDAGGYPRADDAARVMRFLPLEALRRLCEAPGVLLLDELDKPRPEVLGTVLSLLTERQVTEEFKLHPDTYIVGAMQPMEDWLEETPATRDALASRLLMLPIPRTYTYVVEKWKYFSAQDLKEAFGIEGTEVKYYVPPSSSRTIDWLLSFLTLFRPQYFEDEEALQRLLMGLVRPQYVNSVRKLLVSSGVEINYKAIATSPEALERAISKWSAEQLSALFPYVFAYASEYTHWLQVLAKIQELDKTGELYNSALSRAIEKITSLGDATLMGEWVYKAPWAVGLSFEEKVNLVKEFGISMTALLLRDKSELSKKKKEAERIIDANKNRRPLPPSS